MQNVIVDTLKVDGASPIDIDLAHTKLIAEREASNYSLVNLADEPLQVQNQIYNFSVSIIKQGDELKINIQKAETGVTGPAIIYVWSK